MSASNIIPTFSYADPGDTDVYGEDCSAEMFRRGAVITAVGAPTITRTDGVTLGMGEFTVSGISVISAGAAFAWTATGGIAGVTYQLRFQLTLSVSGPIYRSVRIPILAAVG
jgi:hypothetical protein